MSIRPTSLIPAACLVLAIYLLSACARPGPAPEQPAVTPLDERAVGIAPPVAETRQFEVAAPHGATRADEYYWLRDDKREDPDMLAYLEAENAYADAVMAPLTDLRERIYQELLGRLKQDDTTVPYRYLDYWYYTRHEEEREHPIHARRSGGRGGPEGEEEILLDVNELAEGHGFYQVGSRRISPDQQLLAYTVDTVGRRQYALFVKNLETGEVVETGVNGISPSMAWAGDNRTIFYTWNDPETLLTKRIHAHVLGSDLAEDMLIYQEPDDSFYMGIGETHSNHYLCIYIASTVSNEQRCTERDAPGEFRLIAARERDFEYFADHLAGRWVVHTNRDAENFKLMEIPDGVWNDRDIWTDLLPHDADVLVENFTLFDDFIAVDERAGGLTRIRVIPAEGEPFFVAADEPAYVMTTDVNAMPDTDWLRYTYASLTTPTTTYELEMRTGERRLLKQEPVLGGFDKNDYVTERLWAAARDGTPIPVSVLYRKGFEKDGSAAMLQYGYGSYGFSMDPRFDRNVISLVDRGMVYAIAHIRGGQEMGRAWYEDGKLLNKINTFTDFIDVTDFLVTEGYAAPDRVAAFGGSAGGLLMGAIANLAPDRYSVIVSRVPFVDVVTTMLDESIPLTTNEFDEWGNPEDPEYYDYMLAYSPYDNIKAVDYPAIYVGTGLWDSQVQYWEPAKYIARLRARKTGDNLVVFRTQMEAGHGGRSGRFQRLHETAEYYAFLLNQLGNL